MSSPQPHLKKPNKARRFPFSLLFKLNNTGINKIQYALVVKILSKRREFDRTLCWDPRALAKAKNYLEKGMSSEIPKFPDTVTNLIGTRTEHTTAEIPHEAS